MLENQDFRFGVGFKDDHVDNMETDAVSEEEIQNAAALFILKIREGHRIVSLHSHFISVITVV